MYIEVIERNMFATLVTGTGPHAYVSPSWYAERGPFPTWAFGCP